MQVIRKDQLLVVAIFAVMLTTFALVFYIPQRRQLSGLERERTETTEAIERDRGRASELAELRGEVKRMSDQLSIFDRRLPNQEELGQFLRDISSYARSAGLEGASFEPQKVEAGELHLEMPIAMKFKGNFMELARFLRQAKEMTRLTHVRSLTIHNDKALAGQCDIEMVMAIYFTRS